MMDTIQFGEVIFDKSYLFARRGSSELRFTRSERTLLKLFTKNVRKVLTRDQLLDALAGVGSEVSDRNIDYLVNRLRAKLGDNARRPSLIGTQYGEGYVWLAGPENETTATDALLVIGPVFGLQHLKADQRPQLFLSQLQAALDGQTAKDQPVLLDLTGSITRNGAGRMRFSLDVSLHPEGGHLHCALVLRDATARDVLHVARVTLDANGTPTQPSSIWKIAEAIKGSMWRRLTLGPGIAIPQDEPLEMRMYKAGRLLSRSDRSWLEAGTQLAREREMNPNDTLTCLMWATYLLLRVLYGNPNKLLTIEDFNAVAAEIEGLVLDRLHDIQHDPIYLLGAARLLLLTGRGHTALAAQLAEQAFASSAAFAAAFSVLGQIRACIGDTDAALLLYEKGFELCEPDSEFLVALFTQRLTTLLAANRRAELDTACAEFYAARPGERMKFGLFFAPPEALPDDLRLLLNQLTADRARSLVSFAYCLAAQRYEREEHRENLLRGIVGHAVSRFGPEVVPHQVWHAAPRLAQTHGVHLP